MPQRESRAEFEFTKRNVFGVEALRDHILDSRHEVIQLSNGPMRGVVAQAKLGRLSLSFGWFDQAIRDYGAMPHRSISLGTLLSKAKGASFWGSEVEVGDVGIFAEGSAEDAFYSGGAGYALVTFPADMANDLASLMEPEVLPLLKDKSVFRPRLKFQRLIGQSTDMTLSGIQRLSLYPHEGYRATALVMSHFASLLSALNCREVASDMRYAPADFKLFRRTEEYIKAIDDPVIGIPELCLQLKVSRRTLERAFRRVVSMSPAHYLMLTRLSSARADLADGEGNVSDIAMKYGFFELGRFSSRYKEVFGELPSTTRRCGPLNLLEQQAA